MSDQRLPDGLVAVPGDTVAVFFAHALTAEEVHDLQKHWQEKVSPDIKLVIIDSGATAVVVTRPGKSDAARP